MKPLSVEEIRSLIHGAMQCEKSLTGFLNTLDKLILDGHPELSESREYLRRSHADFLDFKTASAPILFGSIGEVFVASATPKGAE